MKTMMFGSGNRLLSCLMLGVIVACGLVHSASDEQTSQPVYVENLEGQIAAVGTEVVKQLSKKEKIDPQVAPDAGSAFTAGLREILKTPLTRKQFEDIIGSLREDGVVMGFDLHYPDPIPLEIEYSRLWWTDAVKKYLERKPPTESEQKLIESQIEQILQTTLRLALEHGDELQRKLSPEAVEHAEFLIWRSTNDPLTATFKRPMSDEELNKVVSWLYKEVPRVMAFEDDPDFVPEHLRGKLIMAMPILWGKVISTFEQRPSLSSEDMKLMREQRHELESQRELELERQIHEYETGQSPNTERMGTE